MDGQCTDHKKRYVLVARNVNWGSAAKHCASLHETGHLVIIRNAEEREALAEYISNNRGQQRHCVFQ